MCLVTNVHSPGTTISTLSSSIMWRFQVAIERQKWTNGREGGQLFFTQGHHMCLIRTCSPGTTISTLSSSIMWRFHIEAEVRTNGREGGQIFFYSGPPYVFCTCRCGDFRLKGRSGQTGEKVVKYFYSGPPYVFSTNVHALLALPSLDAELYVAVVPQTN